MWARLGSRRQGRSTASAVLSAASLAQSSATSLPSNPLCAGVHRMVTVLPRCFSPSPASMMAAASVCPSPWPSRRGSYRRRWTGEDCVLPVHLVSFVEGFYGLVSGIYLSVKDFFVALKVELPSRQPVSMWGDRWCPLVLSRPVACGLPSTVQQ